LKIVLVYWVTEGTKIFATGPLAYATFQYVASFMKMGKTIIIILAVSVYFEAHKEAA